MAPDWTRISARRISLGAGGDHLPRGLLAKRVRVDSIVERPFVGGLITWLCELQRIHALCRGDTGGGKQDHAGRDQESWFHTHPLFSGWRML